MFTRLVLILLTFVLVTGTSAQSPDKTHKVIIQLSSNDTLTWKGLINNIRNLHNAWGDSILIEVVAHGPGIDFLTKGKTTQQDRIHFFHKKGVHFVACENTMMERKIPKENIISEAGFVRTGIGEVILKQELGWSYIKAGF
jgi:uncharacterized protein